MGHPLVNSSVSAVLGITGAIISQVPVVNEVGEWSKLGVSGACLLVAFWLLAKTIPAILAAHQQTNDALRKTMEDGLGDMKATIEKGDDRVATLLQSTLVKVIKDRRGES
jgi:hypothetical protein